MKNFFKTLFGTFFKTSAPVFNHGAILPDEETLASLPKFEEMVAEANPVSWQSLDINRLPQYNIRNQNGSSSCVAFTTCCITSILYFIRTGTWINFSASWVYSQRINKPTGGMVSTNAFDIAQEGMLPEDFMPSDNLSEDKMNNPKSYPWYPGIAKNFALDSQLVIVPIKDIGTIASIIQTTGKPVMVWFDFGTGEWTQFPRAISLNTPYRHSVTAIPPSPNSNENTVGIYNGEKAITIQDQWGKDLDTIDGKRVITESFFKRRNIFAAYPIRFKFDAGQNTKPVYDGSTKSLQDCLKFDGDFPTNIESTGVYGNITIGAVKKFQVKYNIQQTGTVGPVTTNKLRELFS